MERCHVKQDVEKVYNQCFVIHAALFLRLWVIQPEPRSHDQPELAALFEKGEVDDNQDRLLTHASARLSFTSLMLIGLCKGWLCLLLGVLDVPVLDHLPC